jgi:hypothetical protein
MKHNNDFHYWTQQVGDGPQTLVKRKSKGYL